MDLVKKKEIYLYISRRKKDSSVCLTYREADGPEKEEKPTENIKAQSRQKGKH